MLLLWDRMPIRNFNSIKVRLEPILVAPYFFDTLFQFHKGAIRTKATVVLGRLFTYFNSIKVRLELLCGCCSIIQYLHFNSIKVRLELARGCAARRCTSSFQFHKGAIRTEKVLLAALGKSISIP